MTPETSKTAETNTSTQFDEAKLRLLGPEIASQTAESFASYIKGLFKPMTASGTTIKIKVQGKITVTPTKTRSGIYSLSYQDGTKERKAELSFSKKEKVLSRQEFNDLCAALKCYESDLEDFLRKKKFKIKN